MFRKSEEDEHDKQIVYDTKIRTIAAKFTITIVIDSQKY